MLQTTGTVRVVAVGSTGTVTWTTAGSVVSPSIGTPAASTALGCNAQIRGVCERWAAHGCVAIAPEMFHRTAPGFALDTFEPERFMPLIRTLTADGETSTTWTFGFATVTLTVTSCGSLRWRSADPMSSVAWRSDATIPPTAPSGPRSLTPTSPSEPSSTYPVGTSGRSTAILPAKGCVTSAGA